MKKRRVAVLAVRGCLALAALLALWLWPRASRIDRRHFDAIRVGMTRAEVERVLGGRPRDECRRPAAVWVRQGGGLVSAEIGPGVPAVRFFPEASGGSQEAV